jgi:hypothetical protein
MAQAMVAFQVIGAAASGLAAVSQSMNESARMESEARLAETQALQRDTLARDELTRFLSSVKAARAANGLSSTSPNARILEKEATDVNDDERLRFRADDRQRAQNFRTSAAAARSAGRFSLVTGFANAGVPLAQYSMYKRQGY